MNMGIDLRNLDNESIALLYTAGELSASDLAEVRSMLNHDAALRDCVEQARNNVQQAQDALAVADSASPLTMSEAAASRKVARAMAQWNVDRLARPPATSRRAFRWRSLIPVSVAAAVILGITMFVWWSRVDSNRLAATLPSPDESPADIVATTEAEPLTDAEMVESLIGRTQEDHEQLAGVEQQLSVLNYLSESMREEAVTP
jgi:anti-sigma-K factor RskA